MSVHIEVDPSVLSVAAGNLRRSVAVAEALTHQRWALANMVDDAGSGRLSGAVEHFVQRWGYGMGVVVDDATALAERLEAAGAGYGEVEGAIVGAMRRRATGMRTGRPSGLATVDGQSLRFSGQGSRGRRGGWTRKPAPRPAPRL